jgi:glycosyltransferase involved in cell wall biosynthesis
MSAPARPLITIGITCFNATATIERALQSALAQDWPDFEIVVVDDASTDSSPDILRKLAEMDGRIRLYRHVENRGCAAARNIILRKATGAFVAFFDDDDTSSSNRLRVQYERIVSYENESGATLVACYTSGTRYYPNGYEMLIHAIGSRQTVPVGMVVADYLLAFIRLPNVFYGAGTPTCSLMARIQVFTTVGGFDESMRRQEDSDFAVRLAFRGGHFIGVSEPLLQQFVTTGSEKNARIEYESMRRLLNKNQEYLKRRRLYDYMLAWSKLRYRHFNCQPHLALIQLMLLGMRYPLRTACHFIVSASHRYRHERKIRAQG